MTRRGRVRSRRRASWPNKSRRPEKLFPAAVSGELTTELVCYARSVARALGPDGGWDTERRPQPGRRPKLFDTLQRADPQTPTEQAAYSKWLEERSAREEARSDRIHGAIGVIPSPLWLVLFFTSGLIFVCMLFFADSGERALVQALLMGTVVAVIVSMLLLLQFLDNPFHEYRWSPSRCDGANVAGD